MSLYIPGLNLPRANQELWIAIQSDGSLRYNSFCGWHDSQQKAIAVQSHGRLGDLDEIVRYKERLVVDADKINPAIRYVVDTKYIEGTPTIIPAEEGEE